ncbi:hypothetical protein BH18THE2_BH18THE2_37430 [soil metagenome]
MSVISETDLDFFIKEKMAGTDGDQTNSPAKVDVARTDTEDGIHRSDSYGNE